MADAAELHLRGRRAAGRAAYARALGHLDRAAAATDDIDLQARIDITRAYVLAETEGQAVGIAVCEALIDRDDLSAETRGLAWSQLAMMRMRTGEGELALAAF